MKINLAATKTNLIKLKKSRILATEGYELLDEKRRILMLELTDTVHVTEKLQRDVDVMLTEAYQMVNKAIVTHGRNKLEALSFAVDIKTDLSLSQRRVMGVNIPVIDLHITENHPFYSSCGVSFQIDEIIVKFKDIANLLARLAEKKIALLRLAREVKKTIRKVNALEKIYLPYYTEALKYVGDRLDEESREAFSMLKLIKVRLKS